jgi:hypothetical protein
MRSVRGLRFGVPPATLKRREGPERPGAVNPRTVATAYGATHWVSLCDHPVRHAARSGNNKRGGPSCTRFAVHLR